MKFEKVKSKKGKKIIFFQETTLKDYLYNTALNLVNDVKENENYIKYDTLRRMKQEFIFMDVLCFCSIDKPEDKKISKLQGENL